MTDHSNLISKLHVYIQLLQEWNPEGQWQHNHILLAYLRNPYSLSMAQVTELEIYLAKEVEQNEANFKYKQPTLFDIE